MAAIKETIPVYRKAVLSVEEAAAYGNISGLIIKAYALLAKNKRGDFPCFWSGNTLKIPRVAFEKWLEDMGRKNECFEIKNIKAIIKNAQQQDAPKIGRPRKQRI